MFDMIRGNEHLVWWMLSATLGMVMLSLVLVPLLLIRLPRDYFLHPERRQRAHTMMNPALRIAFIVIKNATGGLLVISGIIMLVLPGQGILTIVIGLTLVDFPGKYRIESAIVRHATVRRAIDWIRQKANKPPLLLD
jgi:thiosulfate reductase cytochrome b subunit